MGHQRNPLKLLRFQGISFLGRAAEERVVQLLCNCSHSFEPFRPGISEPTEWETEPGPFDVDGRSYTYYQATQEQRRREREIRALKREEAAYEAAGLKD